MSSLLGFFRGSKNGDDKSPSSSISKEERQSPPIIGQVINSTPDSQASISSNKQRPSSLNFTRKKRDGRTLSMDFGRAPLQEGNNNDELELPTDQIGMQTPNAVGNASTLRPSYLGSMSITKSRTGTLKSTSSEVPPMDNTHATSSLTALTAAPTINDMGAKPSYLSNASYKKTKSGSSSLKVPVESSPLLTSTTTNSRPNSASYKKNFLIFSRPPENTNTNNSVTSFSSLPSTAVSNGTLHHNQLPVNPSQTSLVMNLTEGEYAEVYVSMPEIPDDCRIYTQGARCFRMKDAEVEALYREKLSPSKNNADMVLRQKEFISKLQNSLCYLHLDKKRFFQECCTVEEKYTVMLRKAYGMLRDSNRDRHTALKRLEAVEMNAKHNNSNSQSSIDKKLYTNDRNRSHSNVSAIEGIGDTQLGVPSSLSPIGIDFQTNAITTALLEGDRSSVGDDNHSAVVVMPYTDEKETQTDLSGDDLNKLSMGKIDTNDLLSSKNMINNIEDIQLLEAQLHQAKALATALSHFQQSLLSTISTSTQSSTGSTSTYDADQSIPIPPFMAAKLLSLEMYAENFLQDASMLQM